MKNRLQTLWDDVVPTGGSCPQPEAEAVLRRVNAALNAQPSERRSFMRQKIWNAVGLAAVLAVLAGTALAAARGGVLDYFFEGDTAPGEVLVDNQVRSVSDENYILTVTSAAADTTEAYFLVTVEAKTEAALTALMAEDFVDMDTFGLYFLEDETAETAPQDEAEDVGMHLGTGEEKQLRTETSRTWHMSAGPLSEAVYGASLRLSKMERGLRLEVPLTPAEGVTVEIGAEGPGRGTLNHIGGGTVTLEKVTVSPLNLQLEYRYAAKGGEVVPHLYFLMEDGSLRTWGQAVGDVSLEGRRTTVLGTVYAGMTCQLRSVMDLERLKAVVFGGIAYPLDGGKSWPVEVDRSLEPLQIPLADPLGEGGGWTVPVRALCEALGASLTWDGETRSAAMTYRGSTIVVTEGSAEALVDGVLCTLNYAPAVRDGVLAVSYDALDSWQLAMCAAFENRTEYVEGLQRVGWLVIP